MSDQLDEMKFTIGDFKNQIGQMVKAISHFNTSDRTEAFGYLQNCVRNLEPASDEGIPFEGIGTEENQFIEDTGDSGDLLRNEQSELEYSNYELTNKSENVNNFSEDECETKCCNCGKQFLTSNELYAHGLKDHPGNEISCQNCLKTFSCSQFYKIHLALKNVCSLNKHPGGTLICPFCDKEYQNFQHFSLHVDGHKRNKCPECGVHFNSRKTLEEHMLNKHNKELEKNLFECKFCDRKYAQKRSLLKHYKLMHHKEIIVCLTCGKVFETVDELKSHEQIHVYNSFTCEICAEKFLRKQQYVTHLQGHDKYQCLTCEISYTNKMKLEKHEREGHVIKGVPTDHQCTVCGSLFHFQSSLFFHKKMHSVSSEEHYGCKPCKRIFKSYSTYREHLLTEQHKSSVDPSEESNPTPCKYCNKMFSQKRSLEKHVKRYHCKKKQILYKCGICDFKSYLEGAFQKHERLHTKKKEFICEKCGDSFYTKNALLDHIKFVHNEERNFSCEKCGQTFKSASVLNRHMLCHNDERTFKCHCGQSYKFSGNLNRHQLLAHGKATKSKRVKRLIVDEIADLTSKSSENKKKQGIKEKEKSNNAAKIYTLIDSQAAVSLPVEQMIAEGNFLLSGTQSDTQMLHAACHNLNFSTESRAQLVLSQNLDISTFREVDTLLQAEDSLKTTNTNGGVDSHVQNIFVRHLSEADSSGFLDGESLIHLPIETSLVTSLDDSSLNSVDQLNTNADQSHSQTHLQALPEVPYYSIHFLDI